jgi:hypothetical protein
MSEVWVTNASKEHFEDMWHGDKYTFPAGKSVNVPLEVARHVFGYGLVDRVPVLARLGWAVTSNDVPAALKRLDRFVIATEEPREERPKVVALVS